MSSVDISVRSNIKDIQKKLSALAYKQMPFATASALTSLGKLVQADERKNMSNVLDRPTPFTLNSIGVKSAKKNDLRSIVYVKDIAAAYLEPFEFGGDHKMIGKGITWLNPKNGLPLNQYGNLTKNKLAQLKARSDVFIGKVKAKNGEVIDGVWQRPYKRQDQKMRGASRKAGRVNPLSNTTGKLKLLIRFGDPQPVKQHLNYRARAQAVINANFNREFGKALAKAMATAQ